MKESIKRQVAWIRTQGAELQTIAEVASTDPLVEAILSLEEEFRYSDPISHVSLKTTEDNIVDDVSLLRQDVETKNLDQASERIVSIRNMLRERNAKVFALK